MRALALLALLLLAGCGGAPRYVVGEPYRLGGLWFYPREEFALTATGIAAVIPDRGAGRRTANGERFDPGTLMASHRTLQLPVVLRVTNLESGLSLLVRVNDRGPADPGRVIGLSRRAAELLRIPPGGTAQVRIAVEEGPSRALAGSAPRPPEAAPVLQIATAPRARLQGEALDAPAGARTAAPRAAAPVPQPVATAPEARDAPPPARLPETVTREAPRPGRILLEAGVFSGEGPARLQAQRLGARAEAQGSGRSRQWRVRQGPFPDLRAADAAVARAIALGVSDIRLVVE